MTNEELSIGDWVYRPDCYDQVEEIRHNGVIGYDSLRGLITFSELEPIPITPEILKENGFIEITGRVKRLVWAWKKHGTLIEVNEATPKWYQIVINKETSDFGDERIFVKYVHELQHVLRLCQIEKEIIL